MTKKKKSINGNAIFCLCFIFFIAYNIFSIVKKDFTTDESISYFIVNKLGFSTILSGIDVHPPLTYLIFKALPHNNIYILRFYSMLAMATALILIYHATKRMFNKRIALTVFSFMCLSMTISDYSSNARMYSFLILFSSLSFYFISIRKYYISLIFLLLSLLTHYYAVFLLIPVYAVFLYKNKFRHMFHFSVAIGLFLLIMSPYIIHQLHNPYKITPPISHENFNSFISMLIFPFIIPSAITTKFLSLYSIAMLFFIAYLLISFKVKGSNSFIFIIFSFISMASMFLISYFFPSFPYHHRYLLMFSFPYYLMLSISIWQHPKILRNILITIFASFLILSFFNYSSTLPVQFSEISKTIQCPKNILHETPFSLLPMKIYLPECSHYLARSADWSYMTNDTIYSTEDFIDNPNISYDIYISYFDELRGEYLLNNTQNLAVIRVV